VAKYEQVAESLRLEIENGSYGPGQHIGTEDTLAERFSVSPGTVRRALHELVANGSVTSISGRGWFVVSEDSDPPTRTAEAISAIRAAIASGEWGVGTSIPGERALAARFGVGRITIRKALALLEVEGVLSRAGGGRIVL
jgi:DNA-binding GntR family transcriptional regulator